MPESVSYCAQCGNWLYPGAKFCNECGAKVGTRALIKSTPPSSTTSSSSANSAPTTSPIQWDITGKQKNAQLIGKGSHRKRNIVIAILLIPLLLFMFSVPILSNYTILSVSYSGIGTVSETATVSLSYALIHCGMVSQVTVNGLGFGSDYVPIVAVNSSFFDC